MSQFALVGRRGAYLERWAVRELRKMYSHGVAASEAGDHIQVWRTAPNGDLLWYDGDRTRTLTDKIVAHRAASADAEGRS